MIRFVFRTSLPSGLYRLKSAWCQGPAYASCARRIARSASIPAPTSSPGSSSACSSRPSSAVASTVAIAGFGLPGARPLDARIEDSFRRQLGRVTGPGRAGAPGGADRDLGSMDQRGYLRAEGRVKDMIIRGGENIYPREIEDALFTHPGRGRDRGRRRPGRQVGRGGRCLRLAGQRRHAAIARGTPGSLPGTTGSLQDAAALGVRRVLPAHPVWQDPEVQVAGKLLSTGPRLTSHQPGTRYTRRSCRPLFATYGPDSPLCALSGRC